MTDKNRSFRLSKLIVPWVIQ